MYANSYLHTNLTYLLFFRINAQWHSECFVLEFEYHLRLMFHRSVSALRQPHRLHGFGSLAHLFHRGVYICSRYYLASLLASLR